MNTAATLPRYGLPAGTKRLTGAMLLLAVLSAATLLFAHAAYNGGWMR